MAKDTNTKNKRTTSVTVVPQSRTEIISILLKMLNDKLFELYIETVTNLTVQGALSTVNDAANTGNALVVHNLVQDEQNGTPPDSTIITQVSELPCYFLQGGALIKKSVIATDDVAMAQRSWHQLPSAKTVEVIIALESIAPEIDTFQGKILL